MALLRLFDPTTQFQTKSGALNVAGKLRVYVESTDDLANIYGDDVSLLSQPLILDSNGRARGLFVDSGRSYRLEVYDRNDSLLFTIRRMEPNASGTIINPTVFIKGTPDEIDVEDSVTDGIRTYTVSLSAKVTGEIGKYRGIQTVATINTWTASNLNNGDSVITEDAGTITLGNFAVVSNQELIFWKDAESQVWQTSEGNYKLKQTAKTDPTASGTTITAIDTITQNSNGDITATKKTIRGATTSQTGVVQLAGSIGETVASENNKAASEKAVRDAIKALDVSNITSNLGASKTLSALSETDGKISATATPIQISESQVTNLTTDLGNKANKVANATSGNFAGLDENGNLTDSGKKASDFATSTQGGKADSAIQGVKLNGASSALTPDSNKVVTIPDAVATGTTGATNGLMTAADKQKLNGIASGAEVNQNAFSNVKVGSITVAADTKTDTLEIVAGGATTIKADSNNDKITISSTDKSVTASANHYTPTTDSSAEKDASGGTATQLPTSSTGTLVQVVTGVQMDSKGHVTGVVSKGLWSPNNTYSNASLGHGYGTCATEEATAAKVVTLSNYSLTTGGIVAVKFTYGLCASATMNINSRGAKKIFIDGAEMTATTAKRVLAGDIAYFIYDGKQYHFLGTDKAERKFEINYRASDNALVFSKAFGTVS